MHFRGRSQRPPNTNDDLPISVKMVSNCSTVMSDGPVAAPRAGVLRCDSALPLWDSVAGGVDPTTNPIFVAFRARRLLPPLLATLLIDPPSELNLTPSSHGAPHPQSVVFVSCDGLTLDHLQEPLNKRSPLPHSELVHFVDQPLAVYHPSSWWSEQQHAGKAEEPFPPLRPTQRC